MSLEDFPESGPISVFKFSSVLFLALISEFRFDLISSSEAEARSLSFKRFEFSKSTSDWIFSSALVALAVSAFICLTKFVTPKETVCSALDILSDNSFYAFFALSDSDAIALLISSQVKKSFFSPLK